MFYENGILEAFGLDFHGLGPLFWKVLGLIFEGLRLRAFILEGLGTFEGFERRIWHHECQERPKTWQEVLLSKVLDVVFGTTHA